MLEIENLSFKFDTGEELYSSLSLSLNEKDKCLIYAYPGLGKTTLSKILTGSVPKYFPGKISGKILYNGENILDLDIKDRIKIVGRVSQDSEEMVLFSSIYDEIAFPLENLGLEKEEIINRVEKALNEFDLNKYREISLSELSGGEKKRVEIAILFALNPEVYIFDESFDELSPYWRNYLREKIEKLDKTVLVLASHFLNEYKNLFNKSFTVENKRLVNFLEPKLESFNLNNKKEDKALKVKNLTFKREHLSSSLEPFRLSISAFSLHKGEVKLLLGENGSGKSTFSKLLCGILKEDDGCIEINNKESKAKSRRSLVGYLSQNPFNQLFLPKVEDELKSTGSSEEKIESALKIFNLDKSWYITEISFGRAKLVQSAVFYLLDRDYVILDELDNALSYEESINVVNAFLEKGVGLIIITHDENFASLVRGEKVYIKNGRIDNEC